jgi:hypothetical protein
MVAVHTKGFNVFLTNTRHLLKFKLCLIFLVLYLQMKYQLQCRGEFWTAPPTKHNSQQFINSQYYTFSFCLRSTVTGELALCYLTVYSSYSIWTADTQAIQDVPLNPLTLNGHYSGRAVSPLNSQTTTRVVANNDHKSGRKQCIEVWRNFVHSYSVNCCRLLCI